MLVALCDKFADHLLTTKFLPKTADWDVSPNPVVTSVLRAFVGSKTAVFEPAYFDLDYRSEFSATLETVSKPRLPETIRLHFFSDEVAQVDLLTAVEALKPSYRGYTIIRPQVPGTLGRSVISPPSGLPDYLKYGHKLRSEVPLSERVRVGVRDPVHVFGVPLIATGVPFIEQDGHLLRCAHASAWICHYTAVLRGLVPRRSTATFHKVDRLDLVTGRHYPSIGLTDLQTSYVLSQLDLPPGEVVPSSVSSPKEMPGWYQRTAYWEAWRNRDREPTFDSSVWTTEQLTSNVCRYLNSGFPVILAWFYEPSAENIEQDYPDPTHQTNHTEVIIGYIRDGDLDAVDPAADASPGRGRHASPQGPDAEESQNEAVENTVQEARTDVTAFLTTCDQTGPYKLIYVDDVITQLNEGAATVSVPLPRGLWLSGEIAERAAGEIFATLAQKLYALLPAWKEHWADRLEATAVASQDELLRTIVEICQDPYAYNGERPFALRTYAVSGTDFKLGFLDRLKPSHAVKSLVGLLRLPRFVWVAELLDADRRKNRDFNKVIATVVIDASSADYTSVESLLCHLPGAVVDLRRNVDNVRYWLPVPRIYYPSGRWHHHKDWGTSGEATFARMKGAASTGPVIS